MSDEDADMLIAIALDKEESERLARFKKKHPEAADFYDRALRNYRQLMIDFQRASVSKGPELAAYAMKVQKDILPVLLAWSMAREAYALFIDTDIMITRWR